MHFQNFGKIDDVLSNKQCLAKKQSNFVMRVTLLPFILFASAIKITDRSTLLLIEPVIMR